MARCLVTGGAGFIGSHLVEPAAGAGASGEDFGRFVDRGARNLDRVTVASAVRAFLSDRLPIRLCWPRVLRGVDVVYHLAAAVGVKLVADDPVRTIETNIYPTEHLLRLAVQGKQRVFFGFDQRSLRQEPEKSGGPRRTTCFSAPRRGRGGPTVARRPSTSFWRWPIFRKHGLSGGRGSLLQRGGPRQVGIMGWSFPRFVDQGARRGAGRGLRRRGPGALLCPRAGGVECVVRLMETPAAEGRVFNIGSDEAVSVRTLAEEIIRRVDPGLKIDYLPYSRAYGEDFEDVRRRVPDVSRLYEAIGMKPQTSLAEILDDIIQWKRAQRDGGPT